MLRGFSGETLTGGFQMCRHGWGVKPLVLALGLGFLFSLGGSAALGQTRTEDFRLEASDAANGGGGKFARSLAIDGDYLVVGAPDDNDLASQAGAAYVFRWNGVAWVEQVKLTASDGSFRKQFGHSVSISGDRIAVGGPAFDTFGGGIGSAYVFRRVGTTWIEESKLSPSVSRFGDGFGASVSISGGLVVVGAPTGAGVDPGTVFVFRRDGVTWPQEAKLESSDTDPLDAFGTSVSAFGASVLIGVPGADDLCPEDPDCNSGGALIFSKVGGEWVQDAKLLASNAAAGDFFGKVLSLDRERLVIGFPSHNEAHVYRKAENGWEEEAILVQHDPAPGDAFGWDVTILGDLVLVGAVGVDGPGSSSGAAYLFRRQDGIWVGFDKLVASDATPSGLFGWTVALRCDWAVVGPGAAYGYQTFTPCPPSIPAVSTWSMILFALLLLVGGSVVIRKRRAAAHARFCMFGVFLCGTCGTVFAQSGASQQQISERVDRMLQVTHHAENLLVRFKPGAVAQDRQAAHGAAVAEEVRQFHMAGGLTLVRIPGRGLNGALKKYLANPNVLYAEPDYVLHADAVPDDPLWGDLWGLLGVHGIDSLCRGGG